MDLGTSVGRNILNIIHVPGYSNLDSSFINVRVHLQHYCLKVPTELLLIKAIQSTEGNFDCFGTATDYCDQMNCPFHENRLGIESLSAAVNIGG